MLHLLDIVGAIISFFATVAYIRVNTIAWPLSLISICIGLFLYWHQGIYGDVGLHTLYLGLTVYGWHQWLHGGKNRQELPISAINSRQLMIILPLFVLGSLILYLVLANYTNSHVPLLDATTTVLSLIAQWLICRKIVFCWYIWFIVDAMYAGLYIYKGIPAHGIMQMVYVGMAVTGYLAWQNKMQKQATANSNENFA